MKRYTLEELNDIFAAIAPQQGLLVPRPTGQPLRPAGPVACVYLRHSEVLPGRRNLESIYWNALRKTPVIGAVKVLAAINSILSEHRASDLDTHRILNERFIEADLLQTVAAQKVEGPGFVGVFTRVGCLQLIRHLLLYGNSAVPLAGRSDKVLGELALLTNEFLQFDPVKTPAQATTLDMLLSFLPVWDVYNPRDLGHTLGRMFTLLTDILPGNDAVVQKLTARLGMDVSRLVIGKVSLEDFIAVVFGLFSYGRQIQRPEYRAFDMRTIFSRVGFPSGILKRLVRDRALTMAELRKRLRAGKPGGRNAFRDELRRRSFLIESLNVFRQRPLLKLDANRVLILDLDFLVELLTSGVYWSIFDNLPVTKRETFRELWGRVFEIYAVNMLREFYPQASRILTADIQYATGQVDALLDFGDVVVVFEIKSSLLTETAKRGGRQSDFLADYQRKFVRNNKGNPKALLQLAESCKAIADGTIGTATRPGRIYPVCVCDEPAVESFFFNTYSNEIFRKDSDMDSRIQPATMMSINEFEEILPYVSDNCFSWSELLDSRFSGTEVGPFSVHQAIYDRLRAKALQPRRNQAIRNKFDEVWAIIRQNYKLPKQVRRKS